MRIKYAYSIFFVTILLTQISHLHAMENHKALNPERIINGMHFRVMVLLLVETAINLRHVHFNTVATVREYEADPDQVPRLDRTEQGELEQVRQTLLQTDDITMRIFHLQIYFYDMFRIFFDRERLNEVANTAHRQAHFIQRMHDLPNINYHAYRNLADVVPNELRDTPLLHTMNLAPLTDLYRELLTTLTRERADILRRRLTNPIDLAIFDLMVRHLRGEELTEDEESRLSIFSMCVLQINLPTQRFTNSQ